MSNTGFIRLLDRYDNIIEQKFYEFPKQRQHIMDDWKRRCGPQYFKCMVEVAPNDKADLRTMHDGTNYRHKALIKQVAKVPRPFVLSKHGVSTQVFTSQIDACNVTGLKESGLSKLLNGKLLILHGYTAQRTA